jgi:hypothetical protein
MVLMVVRKEAGLHYQPPKMFKGKLKNNSRNPRELLKNRPSDTKINFSNIK